MLLSLDVLRARKGDCLLLHYGTADDPRLMVIDGGPSEVYRPHLRPRLEAVKKARGLNAKTPLPVDLMMVSHVDDDHIRGILDLTKELITAGMTSKPPLVNVLNFWHNSFENILGQTPQELTAAVKKQSAAASASGSSIEELDADTKESPDVTRATLMVLASIQQGAQLRSDLQKLKFPLNLDYDGNLILAQKKKLDMGDGLKFTVVGPMLAELKALHKKHQEWLKELQKKGMAPDEALAAYVDKSVPNLSSLVVIAELGKKTILLTGDARGDKILVGLEAAGVLKKGKTMHVDVMKVPHHGSANNLGVDLFERVTADHYVFSGDGEHGNPERESFEMLLAARGDADYEVHLTYPVDEIDAERKKDWQKNRNKELARKMTNPSAKVRAAWSATKHGLTGLLKANKALAKKLRIVEAGVPHVIDLHDELGF
jgi:beta-lactamase superfamily II metal-dependent hydrolase